ncbi:MAG: hypothetical protein WED15_02640 [Akkermansiaceae bacterium]
MPEVLTYICPSCATEVRVGELCPGCPKKKNKAKATKAKPKPWVQPKSTDGLDLPSEDFDYGDFISREFGKSPHQKTGQKWYWWVLALAILIAMFIGLILI